MMRRTQRSTQNRSSAASDVYDRQPITDTTGNGNHIFDRATKLGANGASAAIQPEITGGQLVLQPHAQFIVGAG